MRAVDRRDLVRSSVIGLAVASFLTKAADAAEGDYYVIAELVAKPGEADALRGVLVPFVAGARREPGCKHYSLLEDNSQPGRFLTFETWVDAAALDAHMATPQIKAVGPKLQTILAKPFTQIKLSMVSDG